MKKVVLSLVALIAILMNVNAEEDKAFFNHLAVGVSVGTPGIGFDVAMPVCDYVTVRAGLDFMPNIKVEDIGVDISGHSGEWTKYQNDFGQMKANRQYLDPAGQKAVDEVGDYMKESLPNEVLIDGKFSMFDAKLLFDIYPTQKSTFHFTVGFYAGNSKIVEAYTTNCQNQLKAITYFNDNLANRTFTANTPAGPQSYTFGDEIGAKVGDYLIKPNGEQANALVKVNGFRPYVGVGFGNIVPKKHPFTFAFDLGCQFWGTPSFYVQQKNGDVKLDKNSNLDGAGGAIKTISKLSVYPTLNFRLGFRAF